METTKNNIYDSFRPKMSMSAWVKTIVPVERHKEVIDALYAYAEKEGIKLPALKTKIVNLDVAKNIASLVYKVMGEEAPKSEVKKETPKATSKKASTKSEEKKTAVSSEDIKFAEGTSEDVKVCIRDKVKEIGHHVPDWVVFCEGEVNLYPKSEDLMLLQLPTAVNHISLQALYDLPLFYKPEFDKIKEGVSFGSIVADKWYYGNTKEFFKLTKAINEALGIELPSEEFVADNIYDYDKCIRTIDLIVEGFAIVDADVKSNISTLKEVLGGDVKQSFERMATFLADYFKVSSSKLLEFIKKNYVKKIKTSVGTFTFLTAYSKYPQCTTLDAIIYLLVKEYNKK